MVGDGARAVLVSGREVALLRPGTCLGISATRVALGRPRGGGTHARRVHAQAYEGTRVVEGVRARGRGKRRALGHDDGLELGAPVEHTVGIRYRGELHTREIHIGQVGAAVEHARGAGRGAHRHARRVEGAKRRATIEH